MVDRKFNANPAYHPEECGLELIDTLSGELSWEFDDVHIWKDIESGEYYWAADSGCSCPCPFEDYDKLSELFLLKDSLHDLTERAKNVCSVDSRELSLFLSKARRLVNGGKYYTMQDGLLTEK